MDDKPSGNTGYFHVSAEVTGWSLRDFREARRRMLGDIVEYWLAHSDRAPARGLPLPLTMMEGVLLKLRLSRRAEERVMRRLAEVTPVKFEIRSWHQNWVFVGLRQPNR